MTWKKTFEDYSNGSHIKSRVDEDKKKSRHDKLDEFNGDQHGHYWVETDHRSGTGKSGWHYPEGTKKK